jgi:hypothetical protein
LALMTMLREPPPEGWFELAAAAAKFKLHKGARETIWACGTLLELAVLNDNGVAAGHPPQKWAQDFVDAFNRNAASESFGLFSTRRQLLRYTTGKFAQYATDAVKGRAEQALSILSQAVEAQRFGGL